MPSLRIDKNYLVGDRISEAIIRAKAKQLHNDPLKNKPETSVESESFKASRG